MEPTSSATGCSIANGDHRVQITGARARKEEIKLMHHGKTIILCTEERSGSHLLAQHMATTGLLGRPYEYFNTPGMRFEIPDYPEPVEEQLIVALPLGTTPNGVFAVKLHAWTMDRVLPYIDLVHDLGDIHFVYLTRLDVLGQAISLELARQTNIWASNRISWANGSNPEYNKERIEGTIFELLHCRTRWEAYFSRNGIGPLRLSYERVVDEPQSIVEEVARYVGVAERPKIGTHFWHEFKRQAGSVNKEWRERYIRDKANLQVLDFAPSETKPSAPNNLSIENNKLSEIQEYWNDHSNYDAEWNNRAQMAAEMASGAEWICDIGCGPHFSLRQYLPSGIYYMPSDRYTWNEATELCDLSKLQAPSCAGAADACFLLGVLEYLPNVEDAIRMIASLCDWIIFSYCSTDICSDRWHLWINAYSGAEIGSLVGLAGTPHRKMSAIQAWTIRDVRTCADAYFAGETNDS